MWQGWTMREKKRAASKLNVQVENVTLLDPVNNSVL